MPEEMQMVSIPLSAYVELIRAAERIATVERIVEQNPWYIVEDILTALDIKKEATNEQV